MSASSSQTSQGKRVRSEERLHLEASVLEGLSVNPPQYRLSEVKKQKNQARCWDSFRIVKKISDIADPKNDERTGLAQCMHCKVLLRFDDAAGNTHLNKHRDTHKKVERLQIDPSASAKEKVYEAATQWIGKDLLPFHLIDSPALKNLIQEVVNVVLAEGDVDLGKLLPGCSTVQHNIIKHYNEERPKMLKELKKVCDNRGLNIVVDHWKNKTTQKTSMSISAAYVADDGSLRYRLLDMMPFSAKKTKANNKAALQECLSEAGIDIETADIVFTTDEGPDLKSALRNMEHISCADHLLNTVVRRAFAARKVKVADENTDEDDDSDSDSETGGGDAGSADVGTTDNLNKFLGNAGYVVRFAKQGSVNAQLLKSENETLKTFSPTRFCGALFMLESLQNSYNPAKSLLKHCDNATAYSKICEINVNDLTSVVNLLKEFYNQITFLEADSVRLPFVIPAFEKLKQSCAESELDTTLMKETKQRLLTELTRKRGSVNVYHQAALLLHPSFKETKLLNNHQKKAAKELMQTICDKYVRQPVVEEEAEVAPNAVVDEYSTFVIQKLTEQTFEQEWSLYLKHNLPETSPKKVDVMQWWLSRKKVFPKLSIAALRIVPMPATNTSAERSNSAGKRAQPMTRFLLGDDAFKCLMYYHYDKKDQ